MAEGARPGTAVFLERIEKAGYVSVINPNADSGRWRVDGADDGLARRALPVKERLAAEPIGGRTRRKQGRSALSAIEVDRSFGSLRLSQARCARGAAGAVGVVFPFVDWVSMKRWSPRYDP